MGADGLLAGWRVVELDVAPSRPMSLAGKLFADLGATVVRVVPAGSAPPAPAGEADEEWRLLLELVAAGKEPMPAGGPAATVAIAAADVVLAPPGVDLDEVAALNPAAVVGVASPDGDDAAPGPASEFVLQALGGMLTTTGQPGEPPTRIGARAADHLGALYLALGCLAGWLRGRRTGTGRRVTVSLADALVSALNNHVAEYVGKGHLPPTLGNRHLASSPWNLYRAADGFVVICLITDRQWDQLAEEMGHHDLAGNPDYHGQHNRRPRADELDALVSAWTATRTVSDILEVLSARAVPCGDIAFVDDVLADESLYERGLLRRAADGRPALGPLVRLARSVAGSPRTTAPVPGGVDAGRPLDGVRVLEVGVAAAGPVGGRILANLGADVVKMEPAKGEVGRRVPPVLGTTGAVFHVNNSDKRSLCVDLTDPTGVAIARRLVARSDVVLENLAPGRLASWGLDFAEVAADNPELIWTSVTGFGQTGGGRRLRAYDTVVQAASGLMSVTGFPSGIPTKAGVSLSDFLGGVSGALATLVGLTAREIGRAAGHPPVARHLDVSMYDTTVWTGLAAWPRYLLRGERPERTGNLDRYERWQGIVAGADGDVAVTVHDAEAERAVRALLPTDPAELGPALATWAAPLPVVTVVERLRAAGVAAGRVRGLVDLVPDEDLRARALLTTARHPVDGDVPVMGTPVRFSDVAVRVPAPAPTLGRDTTAVLREAGYTEAEVKTLLEHPAVVQA